MSAPVNYTQSGITDITVDGEDADVRYFNIQGQPVDGTTTGVVVRISKDANGKVKAEKIIR